MRSRELLAAGIIQDIKFHSAQTLFDYLDDLSDRGTSYEVLEQMSCDNGSVIIRIVKQYNNSELIQFPEVR